MKKYLTLGLAIALLITLTAIPSSANAQSAGLVTSIINRMERNRRDLRSLRAGISMEKYNAQLRESEKMVGGVIYLPGAKRNSYVRIDWRSPQQETLAVADGKYTLFRPRMNLAYVGDANSNASGNKVSGILGFGLNVSQQQLASAYDPPQYLGEDTLWGGIHTSHMKLVPKNGARYSYAEIWVDSTGMPIQTKVVERNGDATTVRLTDVQKNVAIQKNEFHLELASDVKRVRG